MTRSRRQAWRDRRFARNGSHAPFICGSAQFAWNDGTRCETWCGRWRKIKHVRESDEVTCAECIDKIALDTVKRLVPTDPGALPREALAAMKQYGLTEDDLP